MPQLYAFQPTSHGPDSFFVIAESVDDACARVEAHIHKEYNPKNDYSYRGVGREYVRIGPNRYGNHRYIITVLNPGEVIANDNS